MIAEGMSGQQDNSDRRAAGAASHVARLFSVVLPLGTILWVLWPALRPGWVFFFRDHAFLFHRLVHATVAAFGEGQLPLWDESSGGG